MNIYNEPASAATLLWEQFKADPLSKCPINLKVCSISESHMSFWASLNMEHLNGNKAYSKIATKSFRELENSSKMRDSIHSNTENLFRC